MKRLLRKIIKRKVVGFAMPHGESNIREYVDFITDAPIWQWRKRLWLVRTAIGYGGVSDFKEWLRFLDE